MNRFGAHFRRCVFLVVAACSFFLSIHAHAVTTNWNTNASGSFTFAANWDNGVPDSDDTAVFNRGAGVVYSVTFPGGNYPINYLRVHTNEVTFSDDGSPSSLAVINPDVSIVVGQDAGELAILTTSLSSLSGANASIGRAPGADGTLNVSAGTFSMSGYLELGTSGTGTLRVEAGGSVSNTFGFLGFDPGSNGTAIVNGAGSTWTNSSDLRVGEDGMGTLRIEAGGSVSNTGGAVGAFAGSTGTATVTGIGSTWTNSTYLSVGNQGTGTLTIEAGGSVSNTEGYVGTFAGSTGTATVTGIGSTWANSSQLGVGDVASGTLRIEAGGSVSNTDGFVGLQSGSNGMVTVTGAGSIWTNSGSLTVGYQGTGTLTIEAGGSVSNTNGYVGAFFGSTGTATVTGIGSTWTNSGILTVGQSGTGTLTIEAGGSVSSQYGLIGGGTATVAGIGSTWTNSNDLTVNGTLMIEEGSTVSNIHSVIGTFGGTTGMVTVTGAGAAWNSSGSVYVGGNQSAAGGVGTLTVETGGTVNIGQDLVLWSKGTVNLHGGQISLASGADLIFSGGAFNFSFGTLEFTTSQVIGAGGPIERALGGERRLRVGQHLEIDGALTLTAPFQIDSGHLEVDSLVVNSDLFFTAGLLEVRGGSITGITSLVVPASGEFRTSGVHSFRVTGLAGSTITATGNLTLGNASAVNGFGTQGTVQVGANTLTLLDANDVVFDSLALATLGSGASPGTLSAANGLTLDFGGNITGFGTVSTPNNAAKPLINNGHITGNSVAEQITLPGYVKGVGTLDNVNITGTFSPGLSPTTSMVGNLAFSPTSTLIMEIGGNSAGSQYDQLIASGSLLFDGTLQISLINSFAPALGNLFNVFDWQSVSGTFDTINLPALSGSLAWDTSQLYIDGTLRIASADLPGDFNHDGAVDAADYVVWRKGLGTTYTQNDYNTWVANFGRTAGSGSAAITSGNSAVPEPMSHILLLFAPALGSYRRRRI